MNSEVTTVSSRQVEALPLWTSVLAVVAHPDDLSPGVGPVLDTFVRKGARAGLLCLTHGGSSPRQGDPHELASMREADLSAAAQALGVTETLLRHHPDGALDEVCRTRLATDVVTAAGSVHADGLLVQDDGDGAGQPDHVAALSAALLAAETLDLPVLGADADTGVLRWLRPPGGGTGHPATLARLATQAAPAGDRPLRVEHRSGDQFDINVRGHIISVDQPVEHGGDDTAPTPTELLVASLASCVAFYARRYLARHDLPAHGLAVEATYDLGTRPARVTRVELRLVVPDGVPLARREPLLAVAAHCLVHNTLTFAPDIVVTLAAATAA